MWEAANRVEVALRCERLQYRAADGYIVFFEKSFIDRRGRQDDNR